MTDLKPCPFCGGKAILAHDDKRRGTTRVGCWNVCYVRPHVLVNGIESQDADPEAIERWNTRQEGQ